MKGFAAAWLLGEGIVAWRAVHKDHKLPVPGALAGVSLLFVALAVVADVAPSSRRLVTMLAWGLDIAGLLNVLPAGLFGQIQQAEAASAAAEGIGGPSPASQNLGNQSGGGPG